MVKFSLGRPYARNINYIFPLSMKILWTIFQNNYVDSSFFVDTPMFRWLIRIWDIVDRFLRIQPWFITRIFSISSQIWLRNNIINLCRYSIKNYTTLVFSDSGVTYLRKQRLVNFSCVLFIQCCTCKEICCQISSSSIFQVAFRRRTQFFLLFLNTVLSFSSIQCPNLITSWSIIIP